MRRALAAAAAATTLAGCGSGAPGERQDVSLRLLAFTPADVTVAAGTTVRWRNGEVVGHTVTSGEVSGIDPATGLRGGQSKDGLFDTPLATKGAAFEHTFDRPGTYSYYCSIHLGMNARVVVT